MRMRNTHYLIHFATFYLLFLFSKSCPIILKIILEYLAQASAEEEGEGGELGEIGWREREGS